MLALVGAGWIFLLWKSSGLPRPPGSIADISPVILAIVSAASVGAVLASRRPRHPVGWLLLGIGLGLAVNILVEPYVKYGLVIRPGSLVMRFRRARGVERQQLRWLALAAACASALLLIALFAAFVLAKDVVVEASSALCVALLPLATGAAILRYRLYDLDRIVSRTLAYGILTVLLGGGYAGVVLGIGQLLGRSSSLAVAGATLAVAALFQPARRRIQRSVDRRFNRRRYDAAQTIQAFSGRLRDEVDLDTLTAELLSVVEQTMQPASVSLWLRPSGGVVPKRRAAAVGEPIR
jgi:hypothetical protein